MEDEVKDVKEIKKEAVSADKLFSTSGKDLRVDAKDTQKKALYKNATRKPREPRNEEGEGGFSSKLIGVHRITKVVKGGRTLRFNAVVVMGNKNGIVAVGSGKAREVSEAIKKAESDAKKNFASIAINKTTLPHRAIGKFGSSKVLLLPAKEGSGIIAGGSVKAVLELAGYKDVTAKCYGSTNGTNVVKATMRAITGMRTREEVARLRDKAVEEI
jgi:small subunit ribosomal protein S5